MINNIPSYILIAGHGRSGTNWLLDILDSSDLTHCRNEPDAVPESALEYVRKLWYSEQALELVTCQWDKQVHTAKLCMSERDHHIETPKQYVHRWAYLSGVATLPTRERARKLLRYPFPELGKGEWQVPWWMADKSKLEKSCTILKINRLASWFVNWLLEERQHIPVLHIVRHPGGYLNSSLKRFFSECSESELIAETELYKTILRTSVKVYPQWADRIGNIDTMNLIEAVMWFWCLNNEMIYLSGKGKDNYKLLVYEEITTEPLKKSREIYKFCGLPWNTDVEKLVEQGLHQSVWGALKGRPTDVAKAWHNQLIPEHKELIAKVLDNSAMQSFWP